jgi:hypothetical protein
MLTKTARRFSLNLQVGFAKTELVFSAENFSIRGDQANLATGCTP